MLQGNWQMVPELIHPLVHPSQLIILPFIYHLAIHPSNQSIHVSFQPTSLSNCLPMLHVYASHSPNHLFNPHVYQSHQCLEGPNSMPDVAMLINDKYTKPFSYVLSYVLFICSHFHMSLYLCDDLLNVEDG